MFKKEYLITSLIIVIVLLTGLYSTLYLWKDTIRKLSEEAMEQARIVAKSIDPDRLENLKGDSTDLNSPDYIRIKTQLTQIRLSHNTCRFLYLMAQREDGTVIFLVDSQLAGTEDYAPPGLTYDEVSEEYLQVFDTGSARTAGPVTDRWGTLMTSLVPIHSLKAAEPLAVLGMDIDIKDWKREVVSQISFPISLTISITILTVLLLIINRNRKIVREQYHEKKKYAEELQEALHHVKKLQGLLPICASCKKIRDDKGYWNSIESYIENHSEVQFSHGICDECLKKLYGEEDLDL